MVVLKRYRAGKVVRPGNRRSRCGVITGKTDGERTGTLQDFRAVDRERADCLIVRSQIDRAAADRQERCRAET